MDRHTCTADCPTAQLRVGPVVREDWASRDMAGTAEHENGPNPYRLFTAGSVAMLTATEIAEVVADADWQADPYGPGEDDDKRRRAYKLLLGKARKAFADVAARDTGYAEWVEWKRDDDRRKAAERRAQFAAEAMARQEAARLADPTTDRKVR
jgi:hypothetical protein